MSEKGYQYKREVLEQISNQEWDKITRDKLIDIFYGDGAYFITEDPDDLTKKVGEYWHSPLFPCKVARASEDGSTLDLPRGFWDYGIHSHRSLYIRDAYKDHWEIIKQNLLVEKRDVIYFINGTCGAGKTIETFYLIKSDSQLVRTGSSSCNLRKFNILDTLLCLLPWPLLSRNGPSSIHGIIFISNNVMLNRSNLAYLRHRVASFLAST
jgi:hypothetical protein